MKKKVVYFGYLAKGLLPFLVQLKKELENNDCEFLLFFISINAFSAGISLLEVFWIIKSITDIGVFMLYTFYKKFTTRL